LLLTNRLTLSNIYDRIFPAREQCQNKKDLPMNKNRKKTKFDNFRDSPQARVFEGSLVVIVFMCILGIIGYSYTHTYTVEKSVETKEIVRILDWRGRDVTGKVDPEKISYDGVTWVK